MDIEINEETTDSLEHQAKELTEFVASLEMGDFYGKRLKELLGPIHWTFIISLGDGPDPKYERQRKKANRDYRQMLVDNREDIKSLLVELLRYQSWANAHGNRKKFIKAKSRLS